MQITSTKLSSSTTQTFCNNTPIGVRREEVEVLIELGLSSRQAKVYMALLKIGEAKAKTIAQYSKVNRQEIYRIIDELEQIGLAQRNICMPTTFTATPLPETVKMLLSQKTTHLSNLRQKTMQLTKKFKPTKNPIQHLSNKKLQLGTIFEADRAKKYAQTIQSTRQSLDIITSWKRFRQITILLETQLQTALQRGVIMQIATETPANIVLPDWIANSQTNSTQNRLTLKTLNSSPVGVVAIFDKTIAAITFNPTCSLTQGPDLWTTNPTLIAFSQAYFDSIWTQTSTKQKQTAPS